MRLITLLFAIYIMLLSAVPCADSGECDEQKQATTEHTGTPTSHQHKKQCTPFCTCACCHVTIALPAAQLAPYAQPIFFSNNPQSMYITSPARDISIDIFRPPSVG